MRQLTRFPLTAELWDNVIAQGIPVIVGPYSTPRAVTTAAIKYNRVRKLQLKIKQHMLLVVDPVTYETLPCWEVRLVGRSYDPGFVPKKRGRKQKGATE